MAIDQITFSYTWSSHAVLFNYRVPCNTTQLSETGNDFENLGVVQVSVVQCDWFSSESVLMWGQREGHNL